jgi:predicted nucleotidyltransferase
MKADFSHTGLTDLQISRIRSVIKSYPGVHQAFLFGSRAMGSHRYGSDLDIAIDGYGLTIDDLLQIRAGIDDLNLPFILDLVLIQRIDNPELLDHIRRVGKLLFIREEMAGNSTC